jgi:hypothetical protein
VASVLAVRVERRDVPGAPNTRDYDIIRPDDSTEPLEVWTFTDQAERGLYAAQDRQGMSLASDQLTGSWFVWLPKAPESRGQVKDLRKSLPIYLRQLEALGIHDVRCDDAYRQASAIIDEPCGHLAIRQAHRWKDGGNQPRIKLVPSGAGALVSGHTVNEAIEALAISPEWADIRGKLASRASSACISLDRKPPLRCVGGPLQ